MPEAPDSPEAPDPRIASMDEQLALPRKNGELVFAAPWEARAFGIAVVLNEAGLYPWRDFSQGLAAETATADQHGVPTPYYERWLETLTKLAIARGLVRPEELEIRTAEYASSIHDEHAHHGPHETPGA
jgi:nitrile hydratase accessory protein